MSSVERKLVVSRYSFGLRNYICEMTDSEIKLSLINLKNVCRLCSTKFDIVSIFHKKFDFPQKMEAIVLTLTTVEITKQDVISQNICSKCVAVVIKMFQFRDQAIRNDQSLKAQYEQLTKTVNKSNEKDNIERIQTDQKNVNSEPTMEVSTEPPKEKRKLNNVTTVAPVKKNEKIIKVSARIQEKKMESKDKMSAKLTEEKRESNLTETESKLKVSQRTKPDYKIHSSIASLFRQYPNIRVPTNCLSSDMQPTVVMEMDAVENYFKNKKLNMYKNVQLALNQPVKHTLYISQDHHLRNFERQEFIDLNKSENNEQRTKRKFSGDDSSSERTVRKHPVREDIPDLSVASSQMLHICGVCSSVHSRAMHLARHMTNHLSCQFCKSKFKTLEIKEKHVESECKIQKIMKSMIHLPEIRLQKIELDANVRRKFYKTFDSYGLISKIDIEDRSKKLIIPTENNKNKNTTFNIDISIKNYSGLNSLLLNKSTDIKIIRNLLVQYNKLHRKINNASQTFLPTNELIKVNHGDMTIELKSLKQHLFYYKIPIDVKNGSTVNVCYKYDSGDKTSRELQHWNHLTPVDVNFRTGKNILNRFDPIVADKEIKQELINMEDTKMDEIPIEEIYNLSLPTLKNVNCGREMDSFCDAVLITQANRLHQINETEVDKSLTDFGKFSERNMEVSSTSDNQQIYAGTDCLNTDTASENQNVMILERTGDENVVITIQDKNLSSSTNGDVTFLQDCSEKNSSTSQKNVPIRVKTVCEINE